MQRVKIARAVVLVATLTSLGFFFRCTSSSDDQCEHCQTAGAASQPDGAAGSPSPTPITPDCSACQGGWCRISAGTFVMGAPESEPTRAAYSENQVSVTLSHVFEIAQYEVKVSEWKALGLALSSAQPAGCVADDCPVFATWYDAMNFANLNSLAHDPPLAPCYALDGCSVPSGGKGSTCASAAETGPLYDCTGYRLPTEAEWEYSCRAGTTTAFYDGPVTTSAVSSPSQLLSCYDEPALDRIAWYCTNSGDTAHAVGGKVANPWCLYDMLGNMGEWTNGGYDGQPYGSSPQADPGATLGAYTRRVDRGGNYFVPPSNNNCFNRFATLPASPLSGTGIRLVRTL